MLLNNIRKICQIGVSTKIIKRRDLKRLLKSTKLLSTAKQKKTSKPWVASRQFKLKFNNLDC